MGRRKAAAGSVTLTAPRAARLYKLLTLLGDGPQTRRALLLRARIDIRGFYRDLEALRGLHIDIEMGPDNRYRLPLRLDDALARLPFPDPGLSVRDVLQLSNGATAAHRKLKQSMNAFLTGRRG
jgi:predicted DNA-binding transcriptional regulator YafY